MGLLSRISLFFSGKGDNIPAGSTTQSMPEATPSSPEPAPQSTSQELPEEISPEDVKALLDKGEDLVILDVRSQREWDMVHLDGARLIPLDQIQADSELDIPKNKRIIAHCHLGMRSYEAMTILKSAGYTKVQNMEGGIDSWAAQLDPGMTRY